jgi:hypothetical protein
MRECYGQKVVFSRVIVCAHVCHCVCVCIYLCGTNAGRSIVVATVDHPISCAYTRSLICSFPCITSGIKCVAIAGRSVVSCRHNQTPTKFIRTPYFSLLNTHTPYFPLFNTRTAYFPLLNTRSPYFPLLNTRTPYFMLLYTRTPFFPLFNTRTPYFLLLNT